MIRSVVAELFMGGKKEHFSSNNLDELLSQIDDCLKNAGH